MLRSGCTTGVQAGAQCPGRMPGAGACGHTHTKRRVCGDGWRWGGGQAGAHANSIQGLPSGQQGAHKEAPCLAELHHLPPAQPCLLGASGAPHLGKPARPMACMHLDYDARCRAFRVAQATCRKEQGGQATMQQQGAKRSPPASCAACQLLHFGSTAYCTAPSASRTGAGIMPGALPWQSRSGSVRCRRASSAEGGRPVGCACPLAFT